MWHSSHKCTRTHTWKTWKKHWIPNKAGDCWLLTICLAGMVAQINSSCVAWLVQWRCILHVCWQVFVLLRVVLTLDWAVPLTSVCLSVSQFWAYGGSDVACSILFMDQIRQLPHVWGDWPLFRELVHLWVLASKRSWYNREIKRCCFLGLPLWYWRSW